MGLGKTVQICTLISRLCTARSFALNAKAIVVVPLSTIAHWEREFEAWTDLTAVTYYGNGTARDNIRRFELKGDFFALCTTRSILRIEID